MDEVEEDSGCEIPEWVVTFGDMMSLLLTFFIMLVSLSEIKEEEKYQAMVDSMQRRFGYQNSMDSLVNGESRPRPTAFSPLATVGRAKQKDLHSGGVEAQAPSGEKPAVRIIRPGRLTAVGSVVFFEIGSEDLSSEGRLVLDAIAGELKGKPQKIEIRGHTSARMAARATDAREPMQLAYSRSVVVFNYLVNKHGIDSKRCRLSAAADGEPMHTGGGASRQSKNPRVEVFLLDETVDELRGTEGERASNILTDEESLEASDG